MLIEKEEKRSDRYRNVLFRSSTEKPFAKRVPVSHRARAAKNCLILDNGFFREEAASIGSELSRCDIMSFSEALEQYGIVIEDKIQKLADHDPDHFVRMNARESGDGLFIFFPKHFCLSEPLYIDLRFEEGVKAFPKLFFFLSEGVEIECIMNIYGAKELSLNMLTMLIQEKRSRMRCVSLTHASERSEVFTGLRAQLKQDAVLSMQEFSRGALFLRRDLHAELEEAGAAVDFSGCDILDGTFQANSYVKVDHKAPDTLSKQLFKATLAGHARSSFEGLICVHRGASRTDAYQMSRAVLLSEEAKAFIKPNLEVYQDDVKASHGATIARLGLEERTYLAMRGIGPEDAVRLLVRGHLEEMVHKAPPVFQKEVEAFYEK
ncbi:MAG: hypothetical protein A3F09_00110 [Chlamydiae bacterium RIFCSPHIGHO2_12_FULL_49_11]|nr:MAG: hypothetical protein A3F09_00110 [Chlamydiae bacterium RIFCSPHIGHO2_12_FULL_49_11]